MRTFGIILAIVMAGVALFLSVSLVGRVNKLEGVVAKLGEVVAEHSELIEQSKKYMKQLSEAGCAMPPELPLPPLPPAPAPAPLPAPAPALPPPPTPAKAVTTIDIGWPIAENWDADPEIDGIQFNLTPKDAQGKMVETSGVVNAKLWLKAQYPATGKGNLLQEWSNIQVTKDDYHWLSGVTMRLEYKGFEPKEMQFGILEVTLVTPEGKNFGARWEVMLGK